MTADEGLKQKGAELLGEAEELAHIMESLRKQVYAIDQVIPID